MTLFTLYIHLIIGISLYHSILIIIGVYEEKWGFEKAVGVVTRNPNLLRVPVEGYGSAATSGEETVVLSYIIDITRPIGKPLLAILFLCLLKPFVLQLVAQ